MNHPILSYCDEACINHVGTTEEQEMEKKIGFSMDYIYVYMYNSSHVYTLQNCYDDQQVL